MYHAIRACAFIYRGGDDFEDHMKLPQHIPPDFGPPIVTLATDWGSKLKDARLARNGADYDAYPKSTSFWRQQATVTGLHAIQFLDATRAYLRSKGCKI
jgi:hypothetical protein